MTGGRLLKIGPDDVTLPLWYQEMIPDSLPVLAIRVNMEFEMAANSTCRMEMMPGALEFLHQCPERNLWYSCHRLPPDR